MKLLRMIFMPFIIAGMLAMGMWNKTTDWGWNVVTRIVAAFFVLAGVLFFFAFCWTGFQWPPWPLW